MYFNVYSNNSSKPLHCIIQYLLNSFKVTNILPTRSIATEIIALHFNSENIAHILH